MPRESKVIKRLRELRVFNPHGFYGKEPYIDRHVSDYRDAFPSYYTVIKRGEVLDEEPHWRFGKDQMVFTYLGRDGSKEVLAKAQKWASERFGIKEWVRDPFGSWGDKEYVERRLKELLGE